MGLFECFFPQWAVAENTRRISEQLNSQQYLKRHQELKQKSEVKSLKDEILSLYLINYTLIEYLREKGMLNQEEFKRKMDEIDLRDGKKDGKLQSN